MLTPQIPNPQRRSPERLWADAIRAAALTARARRKKILVSLPFEIDVHSLWRLAAGASAERAMVWWGAGDRQAILGLGSALAFEARSAADVPRVIRHVEDALTRGLDASLAANLDPALARAYGGIAFDAAWPGADVPAARFDVPAVTLRHAPGAGPLAAGAIHLLVAQWDFPGDVADRATWVLGRVQKAAADARYPARTASAWRISRPRQGKDRFCAAVARAAVEIARGTIDKVVVSRDSDLSCAEGDGHGDCWQAFETMAGAAPDTCRFAFCTGGRDGFFGASPERLVEVCGGLLRADSLAGTVRSGAGTAKERREYDLVVAGIRRALAPLCAPLDATPEPVWRALPGLKHLWGPVSGRLRPDVRISDVLAALHPTPAVGGSPRDVAMPLIRFLEGRPRGWYAGAVGWIAPGEADFAVGIRGFRVRQGSAHLTVGAGIVAGSEAEPEWEETEHKAAAIVAALSGREP